MDERRATQRRRRRRRSQRAAEEEGREEGEGRAEKSHHKKKRRTRRESGSGMSESAQLEASDERDRVEEGEGFSAVVDDENSLTLPETFQGLPGYKWLSYNRLSLIFVHTPCTFHHSVRVRACIVGQ